jgi:hypothetical protein
MQKTRVLFSVALVSFLFLSGCVEHQGYTEGLKALEKSDIKHCDGLKEKDQIKECYYTFADGKNDPNFCLKAPDPAACVSDYAGKRQQMSPCDVLKDPVQKYGCVARVAGDYTGRSIEEMVADFNTRGASKKCLDKCGLTSASCETVCKMKEKVMQPYEENGMTIIPVDVEYVKCANTCKDAYISCREDCLSGNEGKDPYFHN